MFNIKKCESSKLLLYLIRWQLSTPILAVVVYYTVAMWGSLASTILANFIGGLLFYKIDQLIFKNKKTMKKVNVGDYVKLGTTEIVRVNEVFEDGYISYDGGISNNYSKL